jgi:hypothetical protein
MSAYARQRGIDRSYLVRVLQGKKASSDRVLVQSTSALFMHLPNTAVGVEND